MSTKETTKSEARLWDYLGQNKAPLSGALSLKALATVFELLIPWLLAYLIDEAAPTGDYLLIFGCGGAMLFVSALCFIFNVVSNRLSARVSKNATFALRRDLFRKTCYLSRKQIDGFTAPSLVTRLTSNTYDVNRMLTFIQRIGVRGPLLFFGGIAVTLTLDPVLTLTMAASLPPIVLLIWFVSKRGVRLYSKTYQSADKMVRTVRENAAGIRVIKAFSKAEDEKAKFEAVNNEVSNRERAASAVMAVTTPSMNLIFNLGMIAVIAVGAFRVNSGLTQTGKIIAFMTYFTMILQALIAITRVFVIYSRSSASSKRIFAVINAPADLVLFPPDKVETDNHIVFENAGFSYLGRAKNLDGVSFSLKRGETLGIIGDIGSGKSTVINLLMRFYDADSGQIRINGEDVRGIDFDRLYNMFGIVFQNDALFADTVTNNIDFFKGADAEQVEAAAADAQASTFIEAFEDAYEHKIALRGNDLSGGQKQRVLLARAFSKNADILILDDAASALDYKTEAALRRAMKNRYASATKIIIAQRVSSIRHADKILMMSGGKVVGEGSHGELIKTCPSYAEIYKLQTEGAAV